MMQTNQNVKTDSKSKKKETILNLTGISKLFRKISTWFSIIISYCHFFF